MMYSFLGRVIWGIVLLVVQGLVFNHISLFGYATPVIYIYMLCIQPQNTSRSAWLLWGFMTGLGADFFSGTPGVGAASMTLTAMCAPKLLHLFIPKDCLEDMVPGYGTLGTWKYIWYVTLLVFLQQAFALLLEIFSFFHIMDMFYTYLCSSLLSVLLILVLEKIRGNEIS